MRTFGEAPPPPTFFDRLKSGLAKTGLGEILTKKKLDAATIAELEEALIRADMGAGQAAKLAAAVAKNRYDAEISGPELKAVLAGEIAALLAPVQKPLTAWTTARSPSSSWWPASTAPARPPPSASWPSAWREEGAKVTLAAGDTFRAAAIEQLRVWADRAKAQFVATKAGRRCRGPGL